MKPEDRLRAIEIISAQNSVTVSFNVPVKDNYSNAYEILLIGCNASTINKLKEEGFSLSLNQKGLTVEKY